MFPVKSVEKPIPVLMLNLFDTGKLTLGNTEVSKKLTSGAKDVNELVSATDNLGLFLLTDVWAILLPKATV